MGILTTEIEYVTLVAGLFDAVRWYSKRVKIWQVSDVLGGGMV
jgi:hypothetical protein